ncbi:annexin A5-like [Paramacrobiotus metropolitanus]|uniref:annexin A5-like n=1 Tax=Paramacrobiotus metropolitanus TaxID=2943436 RepID=UPI002445B55E|nr:annexin A5-like [Paramacrobiotus metropolitanus]
MMKNGLINHEAVNGDNMLSSADYEREAERIHKAVKGLGTDEKTIIDALSRLRVEERAELQRAYRRQYNKPLLDVLRSETSGDFKEILEFLMQDSSDTDAFVLHEALKGKKKDMDLVNGIIIGSKYENLVFGTEITYSRKQNRLLKDDIASELKPRGHHRELLYCILMKARETDNILSDDPLFDAQTLYECGPKHAYANTRKYIEILTNRSIPHLHQVFDIFPQIADGMTIEESIKFEFDDPNEQKAFLTLVNYIRNPYRFYADQLHNAFVKSNNRALSRTIVYLADNHLLERVNQEFQQNYRSSLEVVIKRETSGDHKRLLVALLTKHQGPDHS